ncbi:MAG: hypothetical protein QXU40_00850, partial [Candidatus Pacearchaeota archaeon]
ADYYILLPLTEISSVLSATKSIGVTNITKFNDTGITLLVAEYLNNKKDLSLQYTFDSHYQIKYINATPTYLHYFEKIKKIKITSPDLINNYLSAYKDSLLYWDGDRFVSYPTINKYRQ